MVDYLKEKIASLPLWNREKMEYRMMNNKDFMQEMIDDFLFEVPDRIHKIKSLTNDNNLKDIEFLAHSIAGLAGQMSGERVRVVARELELHAIASNSEIFPPSSLLSLKKNSKP